MSNRTSSSSRSRPGRCKISLMGLDGLGGRDVVEVPHEGEHVDILGSLDHGSVYAHETVREAKLEVIALLDLLNIFRGKFEAEGFDVGFQVLDFATP